MSAERYLFSTNKKRIQKYNDFLRLCREGNVTVQEIAAFGAKMMKKEKLHHHFYGNSERSLSLNALYLTFHALQLPYEFQNEKYLSQKITENDAFEIIRLFEKRISRRIPVEYITNEAYYLGRKFYVNENVLVPRSLMNTRFDDFLNSLRGKEDPRVLDLCTGSGCIGITLALLAPNIKVDLVDISSKALEVAQINVNNFSLNDRVKCIQSDLFSNVQDKYDLIITNPPYVNEFEYMHQPIEVKNEPEIALRAGDDGLDIVNKIVSQSKEYLKSDGVLIAEVGYAAAKQIKKKYPKVKFKWLKFRKSTTKGPLLQRVIDFLFGLHSIFMCEAKRLP